VVVVGVVEVVEVVELVESVVEPEELVVELQLNVGPFVHCSF